MKLHCNRWRWFYPGPLCIFLAIVGWVEPTPGYVGFRCILPKLHFSGVIMKGETQQQPISEPIHDSFLID